MTRTISARALFALGSILLTAGPAMGQFLPLAAVADTSTAVPGGATGEVFVAFTSGPTSLSGVSIAFAGVSDMGTQGIYTNAGGALAAVADTTITVPGGMPGEVFFSFGSGPSLSGGSVAFYGLGDMGTQGIYTNAGGALAAVADSTTTVPGGMPGEVFFSFGSGPSLSGGSVAFSGSGNMGSWGIYTNAGGALAAVADTGVSGRRQRRATCGRAQRR